MVAVCVHEGSDCTHAASPDAYTADSAQLSQVLEDAIDVASFVEAERNVLALGEAAACEIEGEDGDVAADEEVDDACAGWWEEYASSLQLELPWR